MRNLGGEDGWGMPGPRLGETERDEEEDGPRQNNGQLKPYTFVQSVPASIFFKNDPLGFWGFLNKKLFKNTT